MDTETSLSYKWTSSVMSWKEFSLGIPKMHHLLILTSSSTRVFMITDVQNWWMCVKIKCLKLNLLTCRTWYFDDTFRRSTFILKFTTICSQLSLTNVKSRWSLRRCAKFSNMPLQTLKNAPTWMLICKIGADQHFRYNLNANLRKFEN